uniref:Conserved oligomeric Golgi complex subunit 5 putative n=1 Tax=Albugo laibachii Nc14 TaxID=890382 RepID=F0VZ83_9STRA|nr:conserved oligomeric Golgi complex subunit 5 putative [Albugo laibachii Nc14]|eukprot:CCA14099.1 conserved oligomeric Golgi complex subunit 5 putative [Albugo laibachii Nc14]
MESLWDTLKSDPQLTAFCSDCDVHQLAGDILASDERKEHFVPSHGSASPKELIHRLETQIYNVEALIADYVSSHYTELLTNMSSIADMEAKVDLVSSHTTNMQDYLQKMQDEVQREERALEENIQKCSNVDKCSEFIRSVLQYEDLTSYVFKSCENIDVKEKSSGMKGLDLTQYLSATAAMKEASEIIKANTSGLDTLSIVEDKCHRLQAVKKKLQSIAEASLTNSMLDLRHGLMEDALQLLFHLGLLNQSAQAAVNERIEILENQSAEALSEEMTRGKLHESTERKHLEASAVWKAIQEIFNCVKISAIQVWNLERALVSMKDSKSNKLYIEFVIQNDEPTLFATFWEVSCAILRELFSQASAQNKPIWNLFVAEYPHIHSQANALLQELSSLTVHSAVRVQCTKRDHDSVSARYNTGALNCEKCDQFLETLMSLSEPFLERTYKKMCHPIKMMFPMDSEFHSSPPTRSDMQQLIRAIHSEVEAVTSSDPTLFNDMSSQVCKISTLFCENVKQIMFTSNGIMEMGPDLMRTAAQSHNASLLSSLLQLSASIEKVDKLQKQFERSPMHNTIASKQEIGSNALILTRNQLDGFASEILIVYLHALLVSMSAILEKMHAEFANLASNSIKSVTSSIQDNGRYSRYMNELNAALIAVNKEHIRHFPKTKVVTTIVHQFVAKLISLFICHASILRPLEENGKLRLANDMTHLEMGLTSIFDIRNVGAAYEELRAFRHMMFLDTESILRDSTIDKIRPCNVWHHLITQAPKELLLPHQRLGWTPTKYIHWLQFPDRDLDLAAERAIMRNWEVGNKDDLIQKEKKVWKEIFICLETYAERDRMSKSETLQPSPLYDVLLRAGPMLLAGYEITLR